MIKIEDVISEAKIEKLILARVSKGIAIFKDAKKEPTNDMVIGILKALGKNIEIIFNGATGNINDDPSFGDNSMCHVNENVRLQQVEFQKEKNEKNNI